MNTIKFSHRYSKISISPWGDIHEARLVKVIDVKLEELSPEFLAYDTDGGLYQLPKKGEFLLLLFLAFKVHLFTTLRRSTPAKTAYYQGLEGEMFRIVVREEV